jgi:hypothetical protein
MTEGELGKHGKHIGRQKTPCLPTLTPCYLFLVSSFGKKVRREAGFSANPPSIILRRARSTPRQDCPASCKFAYHLQKPRFSLIRQHVSVGKLVSTVGREEPSAPLRTPLPLIFSPPRPSAVPPLRTLLSLHQRQTALQTPTTSKRTGRYPTATRSHFAHPRPSQRLQRRSQSLASLVRSLCLSRPFTPTSRRSPRNDC